MGLLAKLRLPLRLLNLGRQLLVCILLVGLGVWAIMAIYFSNLPGSWLRTLASVLFAVGIIVLFVRVRPWWLAKLIFLGGVALVMVWFLFTPPSNNRDWQPDVAILPYADINGDQVTISAIAITVPKPITPFSTTTRHLI